MVSPDCFTKLVAIVRAQHDAGVTEFDILRDRAHVARDGLSIVIEVDGRGNTGLHVQVSGVLWRVYCARRGVDNEDRLSTPRDDEHEVGDPDEDVYVYQPVSERSYAHLGRELVRLIELQREYCRPRRGAHVASVPATQSRFKLVIPAIRMAGRQIVKETISSVAQDEAANQMFGNGNGGRLSKTIMEGRGGGAGGGGGGSARTRLAPPSFSHFGDDATEPSKRWASSSRAVFDPAPALHLYRP